MKKSEIWIVDLSDGKGHEQKGQRPALVIGRGNRLTVVVPLTTNTNTFKFSFTELIEQTPENGLSSDSVALAFQIASLDDSRFKRKLGFITKEKQTIIDSLIKDLLKLNKSTKL